MLEIIDLINTEEAADSADECFKEDEETKNQKDNEASGGMNKNAFIEDYQMENLEEWAYIMHKDIQMHDYKNGWFGKHTMCCRGEEIVNWLLEKVGSDQKKAPDPILSN